MYLKSGELTPLSNAMRSVAHGGQFVLLDCYQYHRYQSVGPTEMLWMHFDGQAARFYYQQIIAKRGPIFALEQDEKALHLEDVGIHPVRLAGAGLKGIASAKDHLQHISVRHLFIRNNACEICDGHSDLVR